MPRVWGAALLAVVCLLGVRAAEAQQFGRNKVEYVDFDFRVLDSEHFSVHYYPSEEQAARVAMQLAERWYARLSHLLDHQLSSRQPLILYGSHPEFSQTNVVGSFLNEGVGGVTDSARRRIVMPFAPTLAETEHVIGHELVHAFQFDMTRKTGSLGWPLWSIEGMAEFLSLGRNDPGTRLWLSDAVRTNLLPEREVEALRDFSPYRYGSSMWAYLASRFGDDVARDVLKSDAGTFSARLKKVTGLSPEQAFTDWRADAVARFASAPGPKREVTPLLRGPKQGRIHLGPALSPDGRHAILFSERDGLSLDLFLVDVKRGTVIRKLATTVGARQYESLQAIRSSGAWNANGSRFAFAAVEHGHPALVVIDMAGDGRDRKILLPSLGQVLSPSWSPDGRRIAFAGLAGGVTDLFVYDLARGELTRLTDDLYADLQPAWSPDGESLAFVTDRFSTDLKTLRFGATKLAILRLADRHVAAIAGPRGSSQTNPQWSGDGDALYFIADPRGVSNVYRIELASGALAQVSDVAGGVTGLTPTSPALSVARDAPVLAFTSYRHGGYDIQLARGIATAGRPVIDDGVGAEGAAVDAAPVTALDRILADTSFALPALDATTPRDYAPRLSLESIGQPYLSSGGGPLGGFVRGGGSLMFGDLLGERRVATFVQAGNHLRDLAVGVAYLNREQRWNWGGSAQISPSLRQLPRRDLIDQNGQAAVSRRTYYFEQMHMRADGLVAYPFNQTQRIEFDGGIQRVMYRQTVQESVRALDTAQLLSRSTSTVSGGSPATFGEASAAFVGDSAIYGPTSPILGARYRFEASSAFGDLSFNRVSLDYRHYVMPVKPITLAGRILHVGHYGPDAQDSRVLPAFLGSRQFVHGYGWDSLKCGPVTEGSCDAWEALLGSRLLVANLEVRAPLVGLFTHDLQYGPVPAEVFAFADGGLVWSRPPAFVSSARDRRSVTSAGAGLRLNAFGLPLEIAGVRAFDAPARGWSFGIAFQPGF